MNPDTTRSDWPTSLMKLHLTDSLDASCYRIICSFLLVGCFLVLMLLLLAAKPRHMISCSTSDAMNRCRAHTDVPTFNRWAV